MPRPDAPDAKLAALTEARAVHRRADEVSDPSFAGSDFFDARDAVQVKYEMVRRATTGEVSVSAAAAAFGFSRQSYYQAAAALDAAGLPGLLPGKPGPRGPRKLTGEVVDHLLGLREADPSLSPAALAAAVETRFGVRVHPRSVERALTRRAREDSTSG
ncbi:helix-turn-helix domain-containing protein [Frankia sp. CiP3]|uniref:helix-turn-helix domain-containing protein n=1 Tax=Frankia sp. CiP3 TaxID=2880971 RepID=UPI001EF4801A|nr:helix-turn-helix domain-containing protein [Frankia sp. CiP3]